MVDQDPVADETIEVGEEAAPPAPTTPTGPRRPSGHRSTDARDTVAEMTLRAQEISMEAGSKIAGAMKDVISAAAGLSNFAIESARDLVQYMVRRGQMTTDEAERVLRDAEEAHGRRASGAVPVVAMPTPPAPPAPPRVEPVRPSAPVPVSAPAAELPSVRPLVPKTPTLATPAPRAAPARPSTPPPAAAKKAAPAKSAATKAPVKTAAKKAAPPPRAATASKSAAKSAKPAAKTAKTATKKKR